MLTLMILPVVALLGEPEMQPPDFVAYIEETRKAGATEQAQSALQMVASIMVGDTILEFRKDRGSGEYGNAYRSTSCPNPGLSKEALSQLQEATSARLEPILKRLREIADADHSGFVSSREGYDMRRTFEFGAKLSALITKEGTEKRALCRLLHVTTVEFDERFHAYSSLVQAFSGVTVRHLPAVPSFPQP